MTKQPKTRTRKKERWFPEDPSTNITITIPDARLMAFDKLVNDLGATQGSVVRDAIERVWGERLDDIEAEQKT